MITRRVLFFVLYGLIALFCLATGSEVLYFILTAMTLKELLVGFGTQVRSIWMIGLHAFAKRETRMYPEEPVYLPPRYRGRIVLTRDPDGEERCVACNLCAVACPVGCISLQKAETKDGRWYPEFFRITFPAVSGAPNR